MRRLLLAEGGVGDHGVSGESVILLAGLCGDAILAAELEGNSSFIPHPSLVPPVFRVHVAQDRLARHPAQRLRRPRDGAPIDEPDRRKVGLAFEQQIGQRLAVEVRRRDAVSHTAKAVPRALITHHADRGNNVDRNAKRYAITIPLC